jgi:hypothetical protein
MTQLSPVLCAEHQWSTAFRELRLCTELDINYRKVCCNRDLFAVSRNCTQLRHHLVPKWIVMTIPSCIVQRGKNRLLWMLRELLYLCLIPCTSLLSTITSVKPIFFYSLLWTFTIKFAFPWLPKCDRLFEHTRLQWSPQVCGCSVLT